MKSIKAVFHNGIELTDKKVLNVTSIEEVFVKYDDIIDIFGYRLHSMGGNYLKNVKNTFRLKILYLLNDYPDINDIK